IGPALAVKYGRFAALLHISAAAVNFAAVPLNVAAALQIARRRHELASAAAVTAASSRSRALTTTLATALTLTLTLALALSRTAASSAFAGCFASRFPAGQHSFAGPLLGNST